jgi:hypothetical protein
MQSTGNINYSLNKNNFYKILIGGVISFIPFYYIVIFISIIYIFTIRFSKYYNNNSSINIKNRTNNDIVHFFKSLTINSPFEILNIEYGNKGNDKYLGLSNTSYFILIASYIITLIIILYGLIKCLLYTIYSSIIQVNNNNNPYNNPNMVTKTNINPYSSSITNYFSIISLSIVFLIPFLIPFIISILKFDNYNIKHSSWFNYVILFLIFFPIISIILLHTIFNNKLSILNDLNNYIEPNDYSYIDFIKNNFNIKIYSIIPFLFIIFSYCYYMMIYTDYEYTFKKSLLVYFILFFIIFIFIPMVLFFFSLDMIFNNKYVPNKLNNDTEENIITNITNNGITSLYELLVKYNYPCFPK